IQGTLRGAARLQEGPGGPSQAVRGAPRGFQFILGTAINTSCRRALRPVGGETFVSLSKSVRRVAMVACAAAGLGLTFSSAVLGAAPPPDVTPDGLHLR